MRPIGKTSTLEALCKADALGQAPFISWHTWWVFVLAFTVMGLVPGPGVTSIVGYAIGSGRRTALASAVGNGVAISLSLAGVGALLSASAMAFSVLKWIAALYLIVLGLLTLAKARAISGSPAGATQPTRPSAAFLGNVVVGVFHPKTIVFFVAFVPQFISTHAPYVFGKHARWLADQHHLLRRLDELRGRDLVCFCAPLPAMATSWRNLVTSDRAARVAWWRSART